MKELYTIKAGNHYAGGLNFKTHCGLEKLSFSVTPDANCLYDLGNNNNMDINKIFGVTWGLSPEKNSFRIGWNCYKQNGLIQYFYYTHNNGARNPGPSDPYDKTLLFEAPAGTKVEFNNYFEKGVNKILIRCYQLNPYKSFPEINTIFNFSGVPSCGIYNFMYFGGGEVAPHDMSFKLKLY